MAADGGSIIGTSSFAVEGAVGSYWMIKGS